MVANLPPHITTSVSTSALDTPSGPSPSWRTRFKAFISRPGSSAGHPSRRRTNQNPRSGSIQSLSAVAQTDGNSCDTGLNDLQLVEAPARALLSASTNSRSGFAPRPARSPTVSEYARPDAQRKRSPFGMPNAAASMHNLSRITTSRSTNSGHEAFPPDLPHSDFSPTPSPGSSASSHLPGVHGGALTKTSTTSSTAPSSIHSPLSSQHKHADSADFVSNTSMHSASSSMSAAPSECPHPPLPHTPTSTSFKHKASSSLNPQAESFVPGSRESYVSNETVVIPDTPSRNTPGPPTSDSPVRRKTKSIVSMPKWLRSTSASTIHAAQPSPISNDEYLGASLTTPTTAIYPPLDPPRRPHQAGHSLDLTKPPSFYSQSQYSKSTSDVASLAVEPDAAARFGNAPLSAAHRSSKNGARPTTANSVRRVSLSPSVLFRSATRRGTSQGVNLTLPPTHGTSASVNASTTNKLEPALELRNNLDRTSKADFASSPTPAGTSMGDAYQPTTRPQRPVSTTLLFSGSLLLYQSTRIDKRSSVNPMRLLNTASDSKSDANAKFVTGTVPCFGILRSGAKFEVHRAPARIASRVQALFDDSRPPASMDAITEIDSEMREILLGRKDPPLLRVHHLANSSVAIANNGSNIDGQANTVIRLHGADGQETYFRAPSAFLAEFWQSTLKHAGKQLAAQRTSYTALQASLSDAALLEQARRGHCSRGPFALPFDVTCAHEGKLVPDMLVSLLEFVETQGLYEEGLYRISGDGKAVRSLEFQLDADCPFKEVITANSAVSLNVHNFTSLLKRYFSQHDGILTATHIVALIDAVDSKKHTTFDARFQALVMALRAVPSPSINILQVVIEHLARVAEQETCNKMHALNLATVLAPTLFPLPNLTSVPSFPAVPLLKLLIEQHSPLFALRAELKETDALPCDAESADISVADAAQYAEMLQDISTTTSRSRDKSELSQDVDLSRVSIASSIPLPPSPLQTVDILHETSRVSSQYGRAQ